MRITFPVVFALLAFASAGCQGGKKSTGASGEEQVRSTPAPLVFPGEWPGEDALLLSLQRTPCMGRCPVYKIAVYRDGSFRYEGAQFTDRLGVYYGVIDLSRVQPILDLAEKIGFRKLADEYPSGENRIMDLPSAILTLQPEGWQKTVVSRNHANPQVEGEEQVVRQLQELALLIDGLLEGMDLIQVGEGRQD